MIARLALAILFPLMAVAMQWMLWRWIDPFVWFLFFPAVFLCARFGGFVCGILGTLLSAGMVWFVFLPPQLSWKIANPSGLTSVAMFLVIGTLFSHSQERLRRSLRETDDALGEARTANDKITGLYHHVSSRLDAAKREAGRSAIDPGRIDPGAAAGEIRDNVDMIAVIAKALEEAQRLAGVGSWTWTVGDERTIWSQEMYRIFGLDPAMPPPGYAKTSDFFTPESWARLSVARAAAVAEGISYECDAEVVRPDGSRRWVISRGEAYRNADGKIMGVHGTVQDITERKSAEETLRRQAEELTRRNDELERFNHATVGREMDIIDLKELVNELSRQLGRDAPFPLAFLESTDAPGRDGQR